MKNYYEKELDSVREMKDPAPTRNVFADCTDFGPAYIDIRKRYEAAKDNSKSFSTQLWQFWTAVKNDRAEQARMALEKMLDISEAAASAWLYTCAAIAKAIEEGKQDE